MAQVKHKSLFYFLDKVNDPRKSNSFEFNNEPNTARSTEKASNVASPRIDSMYHKYYEIIDKKSNSGSVVTSTDWKKNIKISAVNKSGKKEPLNKKIDISSLSINTRGGILSQITNSNINTIKHFNKANTSEVESKNANVKIAKTSLNTKQNSRKHSIDKTQFKNTKNLFLAINTHKNTLKASMNTSTNNSSSTLLTNNQVRYLNHNEEFNNNNNNVNSIVPTEQSTKRATKLINAGHTKVVSEIPVLSNKNIDILKGSNVIGNILSNSITKNFLYANSIKYYKDVKSAQNSDFVNNFSKKKDSNVNKEKDNTIISKKLGPVSVPITSLNSKNNSKNNSKSVSRIEESVENPYLNLAASNKEKNVLLQDKAKLVGNLVNGFSSIKHSSKIAKLQPVTTTNSPSNKLSKDISNNFATKVKAVEITNKDSDKQIKIDKKLSSKINLDLDSNFKGKDKLTFRQTSSISDNNNLKKKNSFEHLLDASNDSMKSTTRECNYFRKESDKLANYIRQCMF